MGCQTSSSQHCCPPGSWPALTLTYSPVGKNEDIDGVKVYHVGEGQKVLLIFEDIFGIESGRHKSLADTYAVMGFNVYVPEFLYPPYSGSIQDVPKILQIVKQQKISDMKAKYEKLSSHLNGKGHTKWFAAGYCWGAWVAVRMSADYDNITAIAAIHPSFQCQFFYGGSDQALVKSVKCPMFLYAAGNDQQNVKTNGALAKYLIERFKDKSGVIQFPNQKHGWMVRSDPDNQQAKKDIEKSFAHTKEYFNKFS